MTHNTRIIMAIVTTAITLCCSVACCSAGAFSIIDDGESIDLDIPPLMLGVPTICLGIAVWLVPLLIWGVVLYKARDSKSARRALLSLFLVPAIGIFPELVIGIVGHFVGRLVIFVALPALVLGSIAGFFVMFVGNLALITQVIFLGVPAILFGYSAILGTMVGASTRLLCRWLRCNNALVATIVGLVNAGAAYTVLQSIAVWAFGVPRLASLCDWWLEAGATFKPTLAHTVQATPLWSLILVGLDSLVFLTPAVLLPCWLATGTPFCEQCGQWYSGWRREFDRPSEIAEGIAQVLALDGDEVASAANKLAASAEVVLDVGLRRCERCSDAPYYVGVDTVRRRIIAMGFFAMSYLAYQELAGRLGAGGRPWHYGMVPAEMVRHLEELFFPDPEDPPAEA
jgi:nitrate reductase NapE component